MFVTETQPEKVRRVLRGQDTPSLARRRKIALLSAIGLIDFAIISLYQSGVIRHLPDIPGQYFDSDMVNASTTAYRWNIPDGTTGTMMYSANLVLATLGGDRNLGRNRWISLVLAGVVAGGAFGALGYMYDMFFKQKKICLYCLLGAVVNLTMLPLAINEVREDLKHSH